MTNKQDSIKRRRRSWIKADDISGYLFIAVAMIIFAAFTSFKFANSTLFGPMMSGATISALPMFVLFFSLQKYFLEGVTIGAVKG